MPSPRLSHPAGRAWTLSGTCRWRAPRHDARLAALRLVARGESPRYIWYTLAMPSRRRPKVAMTPPEIAEFIAAERTAIICTLGTAGRIHAVPMWFVPDDDGVAFSAKSKSQKVVNARRNNRATILIEAGHTYFELRGVQMSGIVEVIDDPATVLKYVSALSARYEQGVDSTRSAAEKARNRSVIRFMPDRVASWDHRKLLDTMRPGPAE